MNQDLRERESKRQRSAPAEIACKELLALFPDYLSLELDSELRLVFERHLANCPDCGVLLKTYQKTIEATRLFLRSQSLSERRFNLSFRSLNSMHRRMPNRHLIS